MNAVIPAESMASCSNICGSKQAQADIEGGHPRYGVRSYLHQFYEDCTASIWENEDDFQIQRSPNRWSSVLWKVSGEMMENGIGAARAERFDAFAVTLNAPFFS